jgi:hypothetical protein
VTDRLPVGPDPFAGAARGDRRRRLLRGAEAVQEGYPLAELRQHGLDALHLGEQSLVSPEKSPALAIELVALGGDGAHQPRGCSLAHLGEGLPDIGEHPC